VLLNKNKNDPLSAPTPAKDPNCRRDSTWSFFGFRGERSLTKSGIWDSPVNSLPNFQNRQTTQLFRASTPGLDHSLRSPSRTVSPVALGFSDPDDGIHKAPLGDDRANVRRASPPGFFPTVFHSSYQRTMARPDLNDFGSDTSTTSGANYTIIPKMSSLPASI
jgi:hypothetical protein